MLDLFLPAFTTFLVIVDPLAVVPIFGALTEGVAPAARRAMAIKGTLVATAVLAFFALFGREFLGAIGVTLPALRVAGGALLFMMAMEMVFEKRTERRERTAERIEEELHVVDVSVFPVAVPLLAGPGAIATVMLLFSEHQGDWLAIGTVSAALVLVLILTLVLSLLVGPIMRAMGPTLMQVLTRVLGLILAAFAVQFILSGIESFFGL